mmetsp:Transcript_124535/g.278481  ORF Transcript_124535/g.278481 Transcript_124535/m.278481 type:complete len:558 (+) Transcript_124535:57-1730(+)
MPSLRPRAAAFLVGSSIALAAGSAPSVTVPGLGELQGRISQSASDVALFAGIPYAKPPVGDLRWRPPQPYGAWESPREAKSYGSPCLGALAMGESEDCLYLNVAARTSGLGGDAKVPVMVWLYGGAFDNGNANTYTPGAMLGASEQPVVIVTFNYRINVFGFLGSKALAARSPDGSTGNYGLQDQRLALQWVRDHISAFGGDGGDVTVFGQSAGGNSILHHMVQPASFGLFKRAIIESGTYESGASLADADKIYNGLLQQAGCKDVDCLLNMSGKDVEAVKNELFKNSTLELLHWGPVVDGVSTTGTPQKLVAAKKFNSKVPVLMGSVRDEWSIFSNIITGNKTFYPEKMTEEQFDRLFAYLGEENVKTVKKLYDPSAYPYPVHLGKYTKWWWMADRVGTDNGIPFHGYPESCAFGHCSARRVAKNLLSGGAPAVYMYLFARPLIGNWVGHASEIPFVFHMSPVLLGTGNRKLSSAMVNYWTRFAVTGNPNPSPGATDDALTEWPRFAPEGDKASLRFDATMWAANITVEHNLRGAACDFWDSLADGGSSSSQLILV